MVIGVPREIKAEEYRVGLIPDSVDYLVKSGHTVLVGRDAGLGAGFRNEDYERAGGRIVGDACQIYRDADLVVKVKEPQVQELELLREGQILFTFFHFSSNRTMTEHLLARKVVCIAYELVEEKGILPILRPMSEIAGRLSIQEGMKYLEKEYGGKGILLSGIAGVRRGKVVVIGGGVVGFNAARIACGVGASVTVLEINQDRMRFLEEALDGVQVLYSNRENLLNSLRGADIVVGAVLLPGQKTPVLVKREDLKVMEPGTVLVDVSIDEGGAFETSRPTSHNEPIYMVNDIVHYCVPNIPGIVPRTSTYGLVYSTFPYVRTLVKKGEKACEESPGLGAGLAISRGEIRNENLNALFER